MKSLHVAVLLIIALALVAPSAGNASTIYTLISTGQSGAQTSVSSTNDTQFLAPSLSPGTSYCPSGISCASYYVTYFDATFNWSLGGGSFVIKTNGSVSSDIVLNLYDVTGSSALTNLVATSSVAYTTVPNSYTQTDFLFATPYTMQAGHKYVAVLSSSTGITGSSQYFIKGPGDVTVKDANGNPPTPENPVPEPSPYIMVACGAGLIALKFFLRPIRGKR